MTSLDYRMSLDGFVNILPLFSGGFRLKEAGRDITLGANTTLFVVSTLCKVIDDRHPVYLTTTSVPTPGSTS